MKRQFKMIVDMENAAFEGSDCGPELAKILHALGDVADCYVRIGQVKGYLRDTNGNTVGEWELRT